MPARLSRLSWFGAHLGLAVACAAGCATVPEDLAALDQALAEEPEPEPELGCSGFGCNDNSPLIAPHPAYELHRGGLANPKGTRLTGFRSASGAPYQIDVRDSRLVGLDASGNVALDTAGIVGAVISIVDNAGSAWAITVTAVGAVPFWAPPADTVTTYRLHIQGGPGGRIAGDLCPQPAWTDEWPQGAIHHAMVFAGDRYAPATRTVITGEATNGWFNIACAGAVPAKLHLMRHTESGARPDLPTSPAQRQAMLRAQMAAVCPGSSSFTGRGEKLYVMDRLGLMRGPMRGPTQGSMQEPISLDRVEGLWNETGAVCLGEPRLVHANSMAQAAADALLAKLPVECPAVPPCSALPGFPDSWTDAGLVLSTNPP